MFSEPGQPLLFYSFSHKLGITHNQNNFTFFGNVDVIYKHIKLEEAVAIRCSVKKVFLEILQNSQKNTSARVSSLHQCLRAATLAQAFSSEFCEISQNTFFYRTPLVATS